MIFNTRFALASICPLPAASCCVPILDVVSYVFESAHSDLLAGGRNLAISSNDIWVRANSLISFRSFRDKGKLKFGGDNISSYLCS